MHSTLARALPFLLAATALAGCTAEGDSLDAYFEYEETGRTVHLVMSVVDLYEAELYPGLKANMWAFCAQPFDPADTYSANAIKTYTPLAEDLESPTTSWGQAKVSEEQRRSCSVPGPTIEVTQGDRVVVEFSHSHVHPHTIHWHGQFVEPTMDGAPGLSQSAVESGGSFRYEFIAKRAGTLWYHCHVDTQLHVMQGLYGMFVVKPQETRWEPEADAEARLVFSSLTRSLVEAAPGRSPHTHTAGQISGTPGFQNPPVAMDPDVFLLNGLSYPHTMREGQSMIHVAEGDRLRIRMLNAGTDWEAVHLHGHDMLVTHRDGVPLPQPFYADTLSIGPAERYDVLVKSDNPGAWMLHTHVNVHETNDRQAPGGMHTMMVYHGHEEQCAECREELPGGFPYQKPVFMPEDFRNATTVRLADGVGPEGGQTLPGTAAASATWTFPVDLPCAVESVRVDGILQGGSALGVALTRLDVAVLDPSGGFVAGFPLGRSGANSTVAGSWQGNGSTPGSATPVFEKGTYTVEVSGTAVQSTVQLAVTVDYFPSFEEMRRLHHIDAQQYPLLCGKYGHGTEGIAPGSPP